MRDIFIWLPFLKQFSCFLPGPIMSESEAGCPGVSTELSSTDHPLLHRVGSSRVRQVRQLTVLACGGQEYLHRLTSAVRMRVARYDQAWI